MEDTTCDSVPTTLHLTSSTKAASPQHHWQRPTGYCQQVMSLLSTALPYPVLRQADLECIHQHRQQKGQQLPGDSRQDSYLKPGRLKVSGCKQKVRAQSFCCGWL
jgi:hypothetical protein